MGIDVSADGVVSLTDAHEHRVQTGADRHPYRCFISGVEIHCILRRTKVGNDRNDDNPLIYALKRIRGCTMAAAELRKLHRRAVLIGRRAIRPEQFDVIIPAPSSSGIPARVAKAVQLRMGGGATIMDVLRKATVGQVLASAPDPRLIHRRDRDAYKSELGRLRKAPMGNTVSMKDIDPRVRPCFHPVVLDPNANIPHGKRIVIVDDILASGSTIVCAAELLREYFCPAGVSGLVLLGPLRH